MLWSLIKILLFVAITGLLAVGAGYLMEAQGGVQITVAGTEYTLGPLQSVIAALALFVVIWLVLKLLSFLVALLKFINGDDTAISRYFDRNRERKGYKALTEGLMALASGEGRVAMSKASKAEKYLAKPELTNLLTAQAAEMAGDRTKATETYKKLIANPDTRFVGVRGIMKQKLAEGDTDTALQLAEKAFALKPRHEETQDILLRLQTGHRDWSAARTTLNAKLKSGTMPRDLYTRRDAVMALSEARDILDENASIEAQEEAIKANRQSPDLVPAAVMAARAYIAKGRPRNATRVLKKTWEAQPHPDLAAAFAEIEPDETPSARVKRFATLTRINPSHPETRMLLAELNIVAEDFPEARRALGDLYEREPDARNLTLMAAIERGEGASDAVVQGWLAKALNAPRGAHWICDTCNQIHADWQPICENCGAFDTLSWKIPHTPDLASATGTHLLPLIVGPGKPAAVAATAPEEVAPDPEVVDDAVVPPAEDPEDPDAPVAPAMDAAREDERKDAPAP